MVENFVNTPIEQDDKHTAAAAAASRVPFLASKSCLQILQILLYVAACDCAARGR